uniref:BED-type domain-containing protein n=1 Tax=Heterorhabditis bacteriophora TaxID=37862 RepID=A0A1I7X1E7_HETBA
MSIISNTTGHSSPPYSSAGTEQLQYSTPESHYTDQRTETPSSDQLNIDFSAPNGYSPDMVTGSDRDGSPDSESTSSGGAADLHVDQNVICSKPGVSPEDVDLQRQILRLQGFKDDLIDKKSSLNLLNSFKNSLLTEKLSAGIQMSPKMPVTSVPLNATLSTPPPMDSTPTKRKRQRRNPVWPYFDVIDGTARCKQCLYSTKSVFSTNLKVHLRSHHRADYEKVIQAEDALNLNALLLSGNSSKLFSTDLSKKRMPPMTSSILMTINKLANQSTTDDNPLNSVLRQTLAAGSLTQQLQQVQNHIQQQQQVKPIPQFPLNAANLAALNQMARNQLMNQTTTHSLPGLTAEQFISQFNFPPPVKPGENFKENDLNLSNQSNLYFKPNNLELPSAPHGTDANGMPQPKRRRLRRHPVWMFFKDLEDRMVGCINCNFRTGSAFSTNLKMHLKAHHKEDYERVLKLEDDMRIEENVFGPPNKIKSELIDFIRGGGNASTPTTAGKHRGCLILTYLVNAGLPKASPLVQQLINQTMASRNSNQLPTVVSRKDGSNVDEDSYNSMSMSERLAALVGLVPPPGSVEGEIKDEKMNELPSQQINVLPVHCWFSFLLFCVPRRNIFHSSSYYFAICSWQSMHCYFHAKFFYVLFHYRFWLDQGGSDELLQSELFKALMSEDFSVTTSSNMEAMELTQAPSFDLNLESTTHNNATSDTEGDSSGAQMLTSFDISTLTYDGLFNALSSFQTSLGCDEIVSTTVLVELLRNSAKTQGERSIVETVAASLMRINELGTEMNRGERTKKIISEKMKLKRLFETPEQRGRRLLRMKERYRIQRESTYTNRIDRRKREYRKSLTPDSEKSAHQTICTKEERLRRLREYQRKRLLNEKPEQRERRLTKMRENQKMRRERQMAERLAPACRMELIRSLAPDYEIPRAGELAVLADEDVTIDTTISIVNINNELYLTFRRPVFSNESLQFFRTDSERCAHLAHQTLPLHGARLLNKVRSSRKFLWSLTMMATAGTALLFTYYMLIGYAQFQTTTHLTMMTKNSHISEIMPNTALFTIRDSDCSDIELSLGPTVFDEMRDIILYFIAGSGFQNTGIGMWSSGRLNSTRQLFDKWRGQRTMAEMFKFVFDENGITCEDMLSTDNLKISDRCMRLDNYYQSGCDEEHFLRLKFKKPDSKLIDGRKQRQYVMYFGDHFPEISLFPRVFLTENDYGRISLKTRRVMMMKREGVCSFRKDEQG